MTDNLFTLASRVGSISDPSRPILRYKGALTHAAEMAALPRYVVDREARITNTRAVARRRLGKLSPEDRARVEQVEGVIG